MNQMRRCSNCFQIKPLRDFYRKKNGYQSRCKPCNAEVHYCWANRYKPEKIERYFEMKEKGTP